MTDLKRWGIGVVWTLFACAFLIYCVAHGGQGASAPPDGMDATSNGYVPPVPAGGFKTVVPGASRWFMATPNSSSPDGGVYVVPAGAYVTSFSCVAGGDGGTVTITAVGPGVTIIDAGPTVTVPANLSWGLSSVLSSPSQALSGGSVFALVGITACTVTLYQAN